MTKADEKLIEEAKKRFDESVNTWERNRSEFSEDVAFVTGDHWPSQIQRMRDAEGRPCLTVNRMAQFVRQVCNDQRQNRPCIKVRPVDDEADPETAEIMQGLIKHIEANSNADLAYDTGTYYSVAGGFGFWRIRTDYAYKSFDQEIFIDAIENPLCVYPDADSKAMDGSDWEYCFITDEIPTDKFKEEYGDKVPSGWDAGDGRDGLFRSNEDTVRVAEYFYKVKEPDELLRLEDGRVMYRTEYEQKGEQTPIIDSRKDERVRVKWCLLGGSTILEHRDWAGCYIPVVPVFGDMVMVNGERKLFSLIRFGKDAQRMLNYYRSTEAELMALQPKAPFVIAEGQVEGYEDQWALANNLNLAYLPYKPTTVGGMAVPPPQRLQSAQLPTGLQQMSEIAERDMMNTIGIHEAGLGQRSNETSGAAIMARQREGDTATFHFIDNVTRAIRLTGKILVDLIPKIYDTESRVVRILGQDDSERTVKVNDPMMDDDGEEIAKIYDLGLGLYDVTVSAGPSYTTRRQEAVAAMMQILPQAPQLMQAAGDLLIKAMDWPGAEEVAERLVKLMPPELRPKDDKEGEQEDQPSPEVAAMQQQMQQMDQAMQSMQAELASKQAQEQREHEKLILEAQRIELDRYKAETDRIKAEADARTKANSDLTDSEKVQFEADMRKLLEDMRQDHEIEMALLNDRLAKNGGVLPVEQKAAIDSAVE